MGLAELEQDPRFASDHQRAAHRQELIALLDRAFATRPRAHWEQVFREKGFWFSVVNRISDLPADPQVAANDYLVELDTGLKTVAYPFTLEKTRVPLKKGAPGFSQHTEEVLQQVCGYSMEEILALKETEVVW
jgi:crotonobetainyl-CoA:carnitine CoA-transferase CaiB-like acyl-CoA transferase